MTTVYAVTSLGDAVASDGVITLREAILAANTDAAVHDAPAGSGADAITFDPALFASGPGTILLGGTPLTIESAMTITGPGANLLTVDANGLSRVMELKHLGATPHTISIGGMTLRRGNSGAGAGGGILSTENVTLSSVHITNSDAAQGGGIHVAGGTLVLRDSTISSNSSVSTGGGISVVSGTLNVINSTISTNTAATEGGGIRSSTTVAIHNSTIARNQANRGGGLFVSGGSVAVRNTIVGDNTATTSSADVSGLLQINRSLVENTSGATLIGSNNTINIDAKLASLGDPGTGLPVHKLLPGSPALEAGDPLFDPNTFSPAMSVDQRGQPRLVDGNGAGGAVVDLGAVEATANEESGLSLVSLGFPVVAGEATTRFVIRITDDAAVSIASLGSNDVRITGPGGFDVPATFLGVDNTSNGPMRWAFYEAPAPGGTWDNLDTGTYSIVIQSGGIGDAAGHFAGAGVLRNFDVEFTTFEYGITSLGTQTTYGQDLNESGQVVGLYDSSNDRGFIWDAGVRTDLGTLGPIPGGANATGINDQGQVVGEAASGSTGFLDTAFIWQNGVMTSLGAGTSSKAEAINNAGQVAGYLFNASAGNPHAMFWQNGVATDIGTLGGSESRAFDVSETGKVIGWAATNAAGIEHAFLWNGSTMSALPSFGGTNSSYRMPESTALGINTGGVAVGESRLPNMNGNSLESSTLSAAIWKDGELLQLAPGNGSALDINDHGVAVGYCDLGYFVWHRGVAYRLSTLADMTGWQFLTALAINEKGQISGLGRNTSGANRATLLTPNQPPTTTGIPDVRVIKNAPDAVVDLFPAFADDRDTDDELTFTVAGNTNPALFTAVTLDDPAGTLTLDFAPGTVGTAQLTLRATDSHGLFIETTLLVDVGDTGSIHGFVWNDADGNATFNSEPPIADWTVFLDDNGNNLLDAGEVLAITGGDGSYAFAELPPGTYRVAQVVPPAWQRTFPAGASHLITLTSGEIESSINFGNRFLGNHAPTGTDLADVLTLRGAANRVISLAPAFADQDEPTSALVFTVSGNTNPGLFDALTIDGGADTLTLDYAAMAQGMADITVRATDSFGEFAEVAFRVTVDAYTFVDLHPQGADSSAAYAIDGIHRIGGEFDDPTSSNDGAVLWYGRPDDFQIYLGLAINDIAGDELTGTKSSGLGDRAVHWSESISGFELPIGSYGKTEGYALTSTTVVGVGKNGTTPNAVMWDPLNSLIVLRGGTSASAAYDVFGNQQVGEYTSGSGYTHAALWSGSSGSLIDLHPANYLTSSARGIGAGQQVGYGLISGVGTRALLWTGSAASFVELAPDIEGSSQALAVANGRQVGNAGAHAVIWAGSQASMLDLHSVIPTGLGYTSSNALDVDANGNVVGTVFIGSPYNLTRAAMWIRHQGLPDLQAESFSIAGEPTQWGASIVANYELRNDGTNDAGASRVAFYLSQDGTFNAASDVLLASDTIAGLLPFEHAQGSVNVSLPAADDLPPGFAASGPYTILMVIDDLNVVTESDEGDNSGVGTGFDTVPIIIDAPPLPFGWVFNIGSDSSDNSEVERSEGVAVDADGNVYVAGIIAGVTDFDPGPGEFLINGSGRDGYVAKYSPGGSLIWAVKAFEGGNGGDGLHLRDGARDLALDNQGNIYVVGSSFNDGIVVKLNNAGSIQWTRQLLDTNVRGATRVATDASGNVFIRGATARSSTNVDFNSFLTKYDSAGNQLWFQEQTFALPYGGLATDNAGNVYTASSGTVRKLNTNGTQVWAVSPGATLMDVDVDAAGNVYASGIQSQSGSVYDVQNFKIDPAGNVVWSRLLDISTPLMDRTPLQIAVSDDGRLHVTSRFKGAVDVDPGAGTFTLQAAADAEIFVAVLDTAGDFVWAGQFGSKFADSYDAEAGQGIAVASDGSILVTGYFSDSASQNAADFDPSSRVYNIATVDSSDAFVLKLNALTTIAGRAWFDLDLDGTRDVDDPPIANISVRVYDSFDGVVGNGDDELVFDGFTDDNGQYRFATPISSDHYVVFGQPEGLAFTAQDRGGDATDSDASVITGRTALIQVSPGLQATSVDAGYIIASGAPQAVDDAYVALKNQVLSVPATIGVLANDTDALPLTATLMTAPSHGSVALNADGSFDYTPAAGYIGFDSFSYRALNESFASLTTTVTIDVNSTPTSVGIPDVVRLDPAPDSLINLFHVFLDEQSTDGELTFAVAGNSNAALFTSVTYDPVTGLLTLDYVPGVLSEAQLTIRATDEVGLFVETAFNVSVVAEIPAPVLNPEPSATGGTTNTIYWAAVAEAQQYYVEYDDDPSFASPNGNSGWVPAAPVPVAAYSVPAGTVGNQSYGGSLGLDFDVVEPISVKSLGVFDSGSNGLSLPLQARIYDRATHLPVPGAFMLFPAGSPGTLIGGSRFLELPAPVVLPAGFAGTIVVEGYGAAEPNGNQGQGAIAGLSTNSSGGAVSFVGGGRFGAFNEFPTGVDDGPANRYAAGTFSFAELTTAPVLSHEFTGLTPSTRYHYRVKARRTELGASAADTHTTQADFNAGTLTSTMTTPAGDVTLLDGVALLPVVNTLGNPPYGSSSSSDVVWMAAYAVTDNRTLTMFEHRLKINTSTALQFGVFESNTQNGTYARISYTQVPNSGTGEGFYSSGPISVPLVAGRFYLLAVAVEGSSTAYIVPGSRNTDFGSQISAQAFSNGYPLANSFNGAGVSTNLSVQRVTTVGDIGFAAAGSITSPPIAPDQFYQWSQFNFNSTTPAGTSVSFDLLTEAGQPISGYTNLVQGADLSGLSQNSIRVRANLATTNQHISPTLHDWTLTWRAAAPTVYESDWSVAATSIQSGPPITTGIDDVSVAEGTATALIDLFTSFEDPEQADNELAYTVASNTNPSLFDLTDIDPVTGTLTLDFAEGAHGTADVTIRATDEGGDFVEATFTVTINDPPTTSGIAGVTVDEDAPPTVVDLSAAFADAHDADAVLSYTVTNTNPALFASLAVDDAAGTLTLAYAANQFGGADLTVRATDTLGAFIETTFRVTIAPVNDEPTTSGLANVSVQENAGNQVIDLFTTFADIETTDADLVFSVQANSNPSLFTSTTIDGTLGRLTIDFAPLQSGTATLIVRATDAGGLFVDAAFDVIIAPLGEIRGAIWRDQDGDGVRDPLETGQENVVVYLDLDESGDFTAGEPSSQTGSGGSYSFIGLEAGSYTVAEMVPSGFAQTSPGQQGSPVPPFKIDLIFGSGLSAPQQAMFVSAAARWSQIIIGDLPDVITDIGMVDDVAINVRTVTIDGVGDILAQAGPTLVRSSPFLPARGAIEIDLADIANLEASGQFLQVIIHEMGHVLGFGVLWSNLGLLDDAGGLDPRFTGAQAVAEYAALTGQSQTSVPVADVGGVGTRDQHWREGIFDAELMSGVLDAGFNPLSRLTVASMADLGYVVDLNAADPYTLPGGGSSGGTGAIQPPVPPLPFTHRVDLDLGEEVLGIDFGNAPLGSIVVEPQVTGLSPAPSGTVTATSADIDITFSEPVLGVDASDLEMGGSAAATATVATPIHLGNNTWRFSVSGLRAGQLNLSLAPDTGDIVDVSGNDVAPANWSLTVDLPSDADAPKVTATLVDNSGWHADFDAYLNTSGLGGPHGYAMPVGSASQMNALSWTGMNSISIRFSEDVDVQAGDLTILGVNTPDYASAMTPAGFSYDNVNFVATWALSSALGPDKLRMVLSDRIHDAAGNSLDGEWVDGVSTQSGDGTAGGRFMFRLNVLPGDITGNGQVQSNDVIQARNFQFLSTALAGYLPSHDIDGNGRIQSSDVIKVRNLQFTKLPQNEPAMPSAPALTAAPVLTMNLEKAASETENAANSPLHRAAFASYLADVQRITGNPLESYSFHKRDVIHVLRYGHGDPIGRHNRSAQNGGM